MAWGGTIDPHAAALIRDGAAVDYNSNNIPHVGGVEVNLYAALGLQRHATPQEIKRAYRKTSLKVHPDKEADPTAATAFELVKHAHSVLADPVARNKYDERNEWIESHPQVDA